MIVPWSETLATTGLLCWFAMMAFCWRAIPPWVPVLIWLSLPGAWNLYDKYFVTHGEKRACEIKCGDEVGTDERMRLSMRACFEKCLESPPISP